MKVRIITALIAIAAVIGLLFLHDTIAISIVVALLSLLAGYEVLNVTSTGKNLFFMISTLIFMGSFPFFVGGYLTFMDYKTLIIAYFIAFAVSVVIKYDPTGLERRFVAFLMNVFVSFGFSSIIRTLRIEHAIFFFLVAGFCAWMTDTGAYFVGTFLGKNKLCPVLSPKKTVEGAIGGLVICVLTVMALAGVYASLFETALKIAYLPLVLGTVVASVGGMVGDLFASAVKRCYSVKDYGNLFPGHGGVIDRVDSALFTFPIIYLINQYFAFIV